MTVKELQTKLRQEKFDVKNARVYVTVQDQRFDVKDISIFDNEVHLTVGEPVDDEIMTDAVIFEGAE